MASTTTELTDNSPNSGGDYAQSLHLNRGLEDGLIIGTGWVVLGVTGKIILISVGSPTMNTVQNRVVPLVGDILSVDTVHDSHHVGS